MYHQAKISVNPEPYKLVVLYDTELNYSSQYEELSSTDIILIYRALASTYGSKLLAEEILQVLRRSE